MNFFNQIGAHLKQIECLISWYSSIHLLLLLVIPVTTELENESREWHWENCIQSESDFLHAYNELNTEREVELKLWLVRSSNGS